MAPADRHGYALLPTENADDLLEKAGGPVTGPPDGRAAEAEDELLRTASTDTLGEGSGKRKQAYDGGRHFQRSVSPYLIHPFVYWVQVWNAVLIVVLVVDVVFVPIETAFGKSMSYHLILAFNLATTSLFTADILLQFFLQIPSPSGEFWVFNHQTIIVSYLRGFFLVDVISVLPFGEIHAFLAYVDHETPTGFEQHVYIFHVLRFTKLFRMLRLRRIMKRYEFDMDFTYMQRAIGYAVITTSVSLHVLSCLWATLADYQVGNNWLAHLQRDEVRFSFWDIEPSSWHVYVISTYFSIYTITGIGYGDMSPSTGAEYVFVTVMMIFSSLLWTTIIGEIVSVIRNSNHDEAHYQETMDQLLMLSQDYDIDPDLQRRLEVYFWQARATSHQNFVQERIMSRMSSELSLQLANVLHSNWLAKVWWLKNVTRSSFMVELTLAFDPLLLCPREVITTTDRLYVIRKGLCIHGRRVLCRDDCWGMDMLLATEHLRQTYTAVALSYLHVLFLTRDALHDTLSRFPREKALIQRSYRSLCLMRGIVWAARRRAKAEAEGLDPDQIDWRRSLTPMSPANKRKDPFARMSEANASCGKVRASVALADLASNQQVKNVIDTVRERLRDLEVEFNDRLNTIEETLDQATEVIASVVAATR